DFSAKGLLSRRITEDDANAVVAHFPSMELLRAATASQARVLAVLASSYNRKGLRSALTKWRVASMLNNPRIELVSNHCL
ncbi:hypothetical protein NL529_33680, partial [Klebsiella pneumoniae]|nr:hypothetical protein [Klebsiella pneumoniae]